MRKLPVLVLTLLCCFLAALRVSAAAGDSPLLIHPYGGGPEEIECIRLYAPDDQSYCLFLPSGTQPETAAVYLNTELPVSLDGVPLESGCSAAGFTPGVHSLLCGEQEYSLTVYCAGQLPAVFIATDSGSMDYVHANKANREPASIRVYENGALCLDKRLTQIKGRGNATWGYDKRPYNIKFEKKTDLLGMGKAKKWSLLAEYIDPSLLHNACGWSFATALGMKYSSDHRHVDLYLNGNYAGCYTVCESVELGETRIAERDLEKANEQANPDIDPETAARGAFGENGAKGSRKWVELPADPEDITGCYLLEYDLLARYQEEASGFVTENGQPIVIKSPEFASQAEVNYIADFVEAGTQAICSDSGFNSQGRHYSEYFDLDSLASAFLLQELSMNHDAGISSFYAYKPAGTERIFFGPIWDMDNAFGSPHSCFDVPLSTTDLWWANQRGCNGIPTLLAAAYRHEDFRAAVREKWNNLTQSGERDALLADIDALSAVLEPSARMNELRWGDNRAAFFELPYLSWEEATAACKGFLAARCAQLDKGFGPQGAYLYYDLNGVAGGDWVTPAPICLVGDRVSVADPLAHGEPIPQPGMQFYCWNTQADGSGDSYFPGDSFLLEQESATLYAIWKTQRELDAIHQVNPFRDLSPDSYYYAAVLWAYYHEPQITSGTAEDQFSPDAGCTREQIITFLYHAWQHPEFQCDACPFLDLTPGEYYCDAVLWAYETGITAGESADRFGVGHPCTREQIVTFLWIAAGRPAPAGSDCPFADASPEQYFYLPVLWAYENGVTAGIGADCFGTGEICTRAQAVCFLRAAMQAASGNP